MAYINGKEVLFDPYISINGVQTPTQAKTVDITENGATVVLPDTGYALSKVIVNTNVESSGGGSSLDGFHAVRFYNDDRTTLLYTVYVPHGSSAIYAGSTPTSTENSGAVFAGFEPAAVNVTADLDCYAVYEAAVGTLDETSWEKISELSADGTAQNYFAVGDTKTIHIEGTVGTLAVNGDYGVYIIGFNHNSEVEGNGIHFGTFKTADGKDICLIDDKKGQAMTNGTKCFNMNHWGNNNYGGWAGCDARYDILGSTDVPPLNYGSVKKTDTVGYDATETCATNPVADTLMAALPSDLRAVMKPMTKYTNNIGASGDTAEKVTLTTDYLPYLAEFEVYGAKTYANTAEQSNQKQYDYYAAGNSTIKYAHSKTSSSDEWIFRSADGTTHFRFSMSGSGGSVSITHAQYPIGVAPIFKV